MIDSPGKIPPPGTFEPGGGGLKIHKLLPNNSWTPIRFYEISTQ